MNLIDTGNKAPTYLLAVAGLFLLLLCSPPILLRAPFTFSSAQTTTSPIIEYSVPQNASYPLGVTMDSKGNVWFSEANKQSISVFFVKNQTFETFRLPTNTTQLTMIWFLFFDKNGYLWFADQDQPLLWRFNPQNSQFANFTTGVNLVRPFALVYNQNTDQVWFTSTYTNQIGYFLIGQDESATMEGLVNLPTIGTANSGPAGISFAPGNNLIISQSFSSSIAEYNIGRQTFEHVWQLPAGTQPVGNYPDLKRNLIWFTDHAASLFGYINESSGRIVEFSTSLFHYTQPNGDIIQSITLPYWIWGASNGMIWFDEHYSNKIARFNPTTNTLTEFLVPTETSGFSTHAYSSEPLRFYIDDSTGTFWFTEFSGNMLSEMPMNASLPQDSFLKNLTVSLSGSAVNVIANTSSSQFNSTSIAGTTTPIGHVDSNLSISFTANGPNYTKFTIERGKALASGNYTLTICKVDPAASYLPVEECSIVYIDGSSSGQVSGIEVIWLDALAAAAIIGAALVSVFIIRRWRD